jgi:hypothetical protein
MEGRSDHADSVDAEFGCGAQRCCRHGGLPEIVLKVLVLYTCNRPFSIIFQLIATCFPRSVAQRKTCRNGLLICLYFPGSRTAGTRRRGKHGV